MRFRPWPPCFQKLTSTPKRSLIPFHSKTIWLVEICPTGMRLCPGFFWGAGLRYGPALSFIDRTNVKSLVAGNHRHRRNHHKPPLSRLAAGPAQRSTIIFRVLTYVRKHYTIIIRDAPFMPAFQRPIRIARRNSGSFGNTFHGVAGRLPENTSIPVFRDRKPADRRWIG